MTRSLLHHILAGVILWCFVVVVGMAAATDTENPNKLLPPDFVHNNDHLLDAVENSYFFNEDDLYIKGIRITTPEDHLIVGNYDNLVDDQAEEGNQLTLTNVDDNDHPRKVRDSIVDFPTLIVDQRTADNNNNAGSKMKASTTSTKIIHQRQQVTDQKHYTEEWLMTKGNNRSHSNHTHQHDDIGEGWSSHQRQRNLQSCVSSTSALKTAVQKAGTSSTTTTIKVCTPRIPMGGLNRRRNRRRLQNSSFNGTNVTLTGLSGGIDLSNRSIIFTCILKDRCALDGEGIARIFYGANASITIDGFQFLNASSVTDVALGSGSALTLIGSSQVTIRDCSFLYNTAPNVGGAIMIHNSTLTLQDSRRITKFLKNEATHGGAIYGIYATIQTNVTTSDSSSSPVTAFQDNGALGDGGAVYMIDSTVDWNQITLEKNDAANGGAAIFIDTNVTMTNISVSKNEANLTGGAFVFLRANVEINNSTFNSNNGNGTVDAITFESSNVDVSDSTFRRSSCYVNSSTLNLTNTCLNQGSNCVLGSSCNDCCKPYISWSSELGYYCGPNPGNVNKCFGSDDTELRSAVVNYASGDATIIATLTNIYGNISDWCTSSVSNWSYLFTNLTSFNENISNWDTSNATTMAWMFEKASSFNQDISNWDTSQVTDMSHLFSYAPSFNQDISRWNTSKVTNLSFTFNGAASFNQDLSKWDTSQVTDMTVMFSFTPFNQDISQWDTSKVTAMTYMFWGASSFNQDISKWDTSNVKSLAAMFGGVQNFNANISLWNVSQVTDMNYMFYLATSFNQDISGWDISKVTAMSNMTFGATAFNQDLCAWKSKCLSLLFALDTFKGTSCPVQSDPVCGTGPFCYTCP